MAYRKLGVVLGNRGQSPARARLALVRAFEESERLTERERYLAAAMYYVRVVGDNDRAITAYRNLLDLHPDDPWALNNLGVALSAVKDYPQAQSFYLRALAADSTNDLGYTNAIRTHVMLGKRDEARALLELFSSKFLGHLAIPGLEARFAVLEGDYETAEARIRAHRERNAGSLGWRSSTSLDLARIAATQGRVAQAEAHMMDAMATDLERGLPASFILRSIQLASVWLFVTNRADRALEIIDEALERHPLDSLDPFDIPFTWLAKLYADAGRPDRAGELLGKFDEFVDPSLQNWGDGIVSDFAEVAIAMAEGRSQEAVDLNRRGSYRGGIIAWDPQLGRAFEQADQPDSAIVTYERYLETDWLSRLGTWDWFHRGAILERLGQLHDARADLEKATTYYTMFVELWAEADPELQSRVETARARLQEIAESGGKAAEMTGF
jgi:tetratricopeptide (TPR) repeat protein